VPRLAFAITSIALIAVFVLLVAVAGHSPGRPPALLARGPSRAGPSPGAPAPRARRAVVRFLRAYLAYEVGGGGPGRIRAGSSPHLAAQILGFLPRPPRGRPGAVPLVSLSLSTVPHRPDYLLASGSAERRSGPEPFAFLFARRGGRWIAVAPAE
jgi:hypothetical protein